MPFNLRPTETAADWNAIRAIRDVVFIDEQSCSREEEYDEFDATSRHLLGLLVDEPVACSRWRLVELDGDSYVKLERFAVLREHRGTGLGRRLVELTLDDARRAGHGRFVMHAQSHLVRFYESFGFTAEGAEFMEANISHFRMRMCDSDR